MKSLLINLFTDQRTVKNPPTLDKNKTRDKLFANQRLGFPL